MFGHKVLGKLFFMTYVKKDDFLCSNVTPTGSIYNYESKYRFLGPSFLKKKWMPFHH
jgi:hypothetical protein